MIPKMEINQKITDQKADLLSLLTTEIKLPITDIIKISFDSVTRQGLFLITIDQNKKLKLTFSFENNSFKWDINSIKSKLDSVGINVLKGNIEAIKQKLLSKLGIEIKSTDSISFGLKDGIYIVDRNKLTPTIGITVKFENSEWTVRRT